MAQDMWLNLPVKDLAESVTFLTGIGFARNPGPGNGENCASFTIGANKVVLMLFAQDVFPGCTNNALSDTAKGTEVLFSLGVHSRDPDGHRWNVLFMDAGKMPR